MALRKQAAADKILDIGMKLLSKNAIEETTVEEYQKEADLAACRVRIWEIRVEAEKRKEQSPQEIAEAFIRHLEVAGEEYGEQHYFKDGKIVAVVMAMVGPNTEKFREACHQWLTDNGFSDSREV